VDLYSAYRFKKNVQCAGQTEQDCLEELFKTVRTIH